MAPEVMCAQNHTYLVDHFAVGVMAFEFMYGIRPYLGKSRKEIKELILSKQVQIKQGDIFEGWSLESADFINKVNNLNNKLKIFFKYFIKFFHFFRCCKENLSKD